MISVGDIRYLAGLLEADGCFRFNCRSPNIRLGMCDLDVVRAAADLLGHQRPIRVRTPLPNHRPFYIIDLVGRGAAQWMMTLYPFLGERRRRQVRNALTRWRALAIAYGKQTACAQGHLFDRVHVVNGRQVRRCGICQRAAILKFRAKTA